MSTSSSSSKAFNAPPVPKFATGMFDNYKTCYMKLEPQILHLQEMYRVHRDALDDEVAVEFRRCVLLGLFTSASGTDTIGWG